MSYLPLPLSRGATQYFWQTLSWKGENVPASYTKKVQYFFYKKITTAWMFKCGNQMCSFLF